MKNILLHRDCAGATVSGLCLVHCIVWPLIPSLFPSFIPFLASLFLVPHDTLWERLHLVEYLFWSVAFLATFFSLRALLRPHHCHAHHPSSSKADTQFARATLSPNLASPTWLNKRKWPFKKMALGCAFLAWLWLAVVAIFSLPHLYSLATSVMLILSHLNAFLFSLTRPPSR